MELLSETFYVDIIKSQKGRQVLWMEIMSSFRERIKIKKKKNLKKKCTYGTISSWRPDRKRIGTSVIDGRKVSDGQT